MSIINIGLPAFEKMLDVFAKTISRTPVTKSINPLTGEETLTSGTAANIQGAFFRREDDWAQDKPGLFLNADTILLTKTDVVIAKNDVITYGSESYRVNEVLARKLGETHIYNMSRCFKI